MKIESFWARGYRSLRDLRIDGLGSFNVFYGPNGSGKSNVLAGIQTLFRLLAAIGREGGEGLLPSGKLPVGPAESAAKRAASAAVRSGLVARRDLHLRPAASSITLGATLGRGTSRNNLVFRRKSLERAQVEITLDWALPGDPLLWLSQLDFDGTPVRDILGDMEDSYSVRNVQVLLAERLPATAFTLVEAIRALRVEPDDTVRRPDGANLLLEDMNEGRLASALFAAKNASDPDIRSRFRTFQAALQGEPLRRPPFDVLRDIATKEISIRERLSSAPDDECDVPLDLAGLGVVQLYSILARILFAGTSAVGVEEPEAHLHAPTSGLHLRELLRRLVDEGSVEQLFIATHANLFDLDPKGYFDVRIEDGATVVERRPIGDLDRHLYEPGPTLHALEELLGTVPADKVMFRRPDGAPVTAAEMLKLLREADPTAIEYLGNLHAAAVDVVGLRKRRGHGS